MIGTRQRDKVYASDCALQAQGFQGGACGVELEGKAVPACEATLRVHAGGLERLIEVAHLSRPENYLSIYQSGCNFSCRKCHSWHFSKKATGTWLSTDELLKTCLKYEKKVTLTEPRSKATSWHASDTCRCCGLCVTQHKRSMSCPGVLLPEQITLSPQGYGPARNIVAFTGGDLTCRASFYAEFAHRVKAETRLWVLIETNGYGLTPMNLDILQESGVDAFWLDIKAYDEKIHQWLTGCSNQWILQLPHEILKRGFVLEVLSLYIPELVEADQLEKIAGLLASVDAGIPFTILAFFPEYR
jgi:pyruvate formate lyase activating enzyme